jgi:glucosyl-3-phosphoglycerate synthase
MADLHQAHDVATLHRLDTANLDRLEQELEAFARRRPIGLVLPCLFSEFSRPAIRHIIEELRHARYVDTVVLSLGQASAEEMLVTRRALDRLPQRVRLIWNDGPALRSLYARLAENGLPVDQDGKGRSCWIAYGYLLADHRCEVIASHDCDITTYSRELLARLCYPIAHPRFGFEFAKGYYARFNATLNGRVTRLFVSPLVRSLQRVVGPQSFLTFLDGFRYPLSGEFAMTSAVARAIRLPATWGLEMGVLAEVYRSRGPRRACQTELCAVYDHKHQLLSADDAERGLLKMCVDIGRTLLRALAAEGVVFDAGLFRTLTVHYARLAEDAVSSFEADAAINSLTFDRHQEETMVAVFARGLELACARFVEDPATPLIPSWERVHAAVPGFLDLLRDAVDGESPLTVAGGESAVAAAAPERTAIAAA